MKVDILAIGIHPDDVELSASGTLLRQNALGYSFGLLDLSMGELGSRGTAELRAQEAKAAADILSYQYFRAYGLPIVRVRAFNHTGPRQGTGYVVPDFCSQIVKIEHSQRRGVIKVGNISAKRDIADVRDIVNGYRLAAKKGRPGEPYILASGKAHSIRQFLRLLTDMSTAEIDIKVSKELLRPVEVPLLLGSISKSKKELGYNPKYTIEQTLLDTLDFWRMN